MQRSPSPDDPGVNVYESMKIYTINTLLSLNIINYALETWVRTGGDFQPGPVGEGVKFRNPTHRF